MEQTKPEPDVVIGRGCEVRFSSTEDGRISAHTHVGGARVGGIGDTRDLAWANLVASVVRFLSKGPSLKAMKMP